MNEEQVREATRAYLVSYDEAMKQTGNPTVAMQAAFTISSAVLTKLGSKETPQSLMSIIGAMMVKQKAEAQKAEADALNKELKECEEANDCDECNNSSCPARAERNGE